MRLSVEVTVGIRNSIGEIEVLGVESHGGEGLGVVSAIAGVLRGRSGVGI